MSDPFYIDPQRELYAGLWTLYLSAAVFLIARLWVKLSNRYGMWYDDYVLLVAWFVLTTNNIIITAEWATGYVNPIWDDRMHILVLITSCGTMLGQSLTKAAFGVTLLKLTRGFSSWRICHTILWFCIVSMCSYNLLKMIVEWGKVCGLEEYQVWYRLNFCLRIEDRSKLKEGGNYYNIVMDFIFAAFPWVLTWNLNMKRKEKIGLCVTMSLGMIVAIESAIRNEWKYGGNKRDRFYFQRIAWSNIWYSSEITGTIIVQCIPVLRPLVRDISSKIRSKRLGSTTDDELALEETHGREWYHSK